MKSIIVLLVAYAAFAAAVDIYDLVKHGIDLDHYWPFVYSGVALFWVFVARVCDRSVTAKQTTRQ